MHNLGRFVSEGPLALQSQGTQLGQQQGGRASEDKSGAIPKSGQWLPDIAHGPDMFRAGLLLSGDLIKLREHQAEMQPEIDAGTSLPMTLSMSTSGLCCLKMQSSGTTARAKHRGTLLHSQLY